MLDQLKTIWQNDILEEYNRGIITTEAALQAALFHFVRQRMPNLEVYIEPGLCYYHKGRSQFSPDIVLCDRKKIFVIGEIKFVPHWRPAVADDLQKLAKLEKKREDGYHLRIDPVTGSWEAGRQDWIAEHWVTDETRYALFVVGQSKSSNVWRNKIKIGPTEHLAERLTLFYGRINPSGQPDFGAA